MKYKVLFFGLILLSVVSIVFANINPSVALGAPTGTQVVNNPITFTWLYFDPEGDPLESYVLLVDDNKRFTSPVAYYGTRSESRKVHLPLEDGLYYWRIEVVNKFGDEVSEVRSFFLNNKAKVCEDGTNYYECSLNKPKYCRAGVLVEDCIKCGCPTGELCSEGEVCIELKCNDGTKHGECSINKPGYCLSTGILKEVCSLCGCSNGLECKIDGNCGIEVVITEEPEVSGEEPEEGFIGFLKRIANVFKFLFTGEAL